MSDAKVAKRPHPGTAHDEPIVHAFGVHDPADPDPWAALAMDRSLPFDPAAKAALLRDQRSASRQFLLPFVRPLARLTIVLAQVFKAVFPRFPHAPKFLHWMIATGMKRFLTPDANWLILRHFHLGSQILLFIADNVTPGFRPVLEPMDPKDVDGVRDNLFLKHDLNIYNFLIQLSHEMDKRGVSLKKAESLDFSAIDPEAVKIDDMPKGRFNKIDLQTAIEMYTPAYAFWLTDRDFWRAANSLQLDETIGLYCARLTGEEQHLAMVTNAHPLVPESTLKAGFRLMLHGLSTEVLHGFLVELKQRQAAERGKTAPAQG
ncbi:hypothetical protein K3152_07455 [Qipengyuania sp. 1NDH17]|uniref:Uncharacterized protein n=1 Tax=Qipengyuania polymorpha TaxID=2867234 RepID=A0ABS7J183_9SPHN|nr:hypothetical protein [Qipengyuania polymorpha]MBX7458080.1 hypothetical protein [Qipengyuania polymorpha]